MPTAIDPCGREGRAGGNSPVAWFSAGAADPEKVRIPSTRAWRAPLLTVLAGLGVAAATTSTPAVQAGAVAVGFLAAAAIAAAAAWSRPVAPGFLALGVARLWWVVGTDDHWSREVVGPLAHFAAWLALGAGLLALASRRGRPVRLDSVLDGLVVVAVAVPVLQLVVVEPAAARGMDIELWTLGLYAAVAAVGVTGGVQLWRTAVDLPVRLLGAAPLALLAAEVLYVGRTATGSDLVDVSAGFGVVPALLVVVAWRSATPDAAEAQAAGRPGHRTLVALGLLAVPVLDTLVDRAAADVLLRDLLLVVAAFRLLHVDNGRRRAHRSAVHVAGRLEAVVEALDELVVVLDAEGRTVWASPAWERRLGLPLGARLAEAIDPHDRVVFDAARAAAARGTTRAEVRLYGPDADVRWHEIRLVGGHESAPPGGLLAVAVDVDSAVAFRNRIEHERALTNGILQASNAAIAVVDERGRVAVANRAWGDDVASGGSPAELLPTWPERSRDELAEAVARVVGRRTRAERCELVEPETGRCLDVVVEPIGLADLHGAIVTAYDVSEVRRHEAEARASSDRLRAVFDGLPVGLARTTPELTIVEANEALAATTGLADLAGRTFDDLIHDEDLPALNAAVVRVLGGGATEARVELRVRSGPATHAAGHLVVRVVEPGPGEAPELLVVLQDVATERRLQRELLDARRFEALGLLTAGVASSLTAPLQVIADNVHYVRAVQGRNGADDPEVTGALSDTASATSGALRTLRSLRTFGHRADDDRTVADVGDVVRDTVVLAAGPLEGIAEVDLDLPDVPPVATPRWVLELAIVHVLLDAARTLPSRRRGSERARIGLGLRRDGDRAVLDVRIDLAGAPLPASLPAAIDALLADHDVSCRKSGPGQPFLRVTMPLAGARPASTPSPSEAIA